jgi:hypothetical protein
MTTIKLKNGSGAPDAADLVQGEVALDLTNKRIYSENASGTVIEMGTSPSTIDINAGTIDGTVIGGASAAAITGTTITGTSFVSSGNMTFGDNDKAIFGAGSDLQIYHEGTYSHISDEGTGSLVISTNGNNIQLAKGTSELMVVASPDGAVDLYHNNSKKLATTSTGIDVTGDVTADGLTVAQSSGANILLESTTTGATTGDIFGEIEFKTNDASSPGIKAKIDAYSEGGVGNTALRLFTGDTTGLYQRLNIASNGDISFYEDTGTTPKLFWDASQEFLGLGTNSPLTPLYLQYANNSGTNYLDSDAGFIINNTGSNGSTIKMQTNANIIYGSGSNTLVFSDRQNERLRIDSSGNMVVGKTNANANDAGIVLNSSGRLFAVVASDDAVFNRTTTDGSIISLRKDGTTVGSIGVNNGVRPYFARPTKAGITIGGASALEPTTDDGTANDGGMDLGGAGARFKSLYLSGSVYLGGTTSANALDDYEEGTWTPTLTTAGTDFTSVSYNNRIATYVKVGDLVTVTGRFYTTAVTVGSPTGVVQIGGLPFANGSAPSVGSLADTRLFTTNNPSETFVGAGGTKMTLLYKATANGASVELPIANVATGNPGNVLHFAATYRV